MKTSSSPRSHSTSAGTSNSDFTFAEENSKLINTGTVISYFVGKSSKRVYFAVLSERSLELHESEKLQKKKKSAKHIIDLSNCFNVSRHYDPKFKHCVAVVSPDETLLMKGDNDDQTADWYDSLLRAIIPARAVYLGRPVFPSELFECVWDVDLVQAPKLKKPMPPSETLPNICIRQPQFLGHCRLCFYPHTIVICKTGIQPATHGLPKTGIPPFSTTDFIEIQRQSVVRYGSQEKYFILRIGRSSPLGTCEIWARSETDEIAATMHSKLTEIIERETEKKRNGIL
jgi:hypothetical protein